RSSPPRAPTGSCWPPARPPTSTKPRTSCPPVPSGSGSEAMGADLFDRLAIRDLVERYAALVDERRPEDAAALFVEDGELLVPAPPRHLGPTVPHRGRAEVAAAMAALGAFTATFHAVHGAVVDLDAGADGATGRVTCTAHHLSAGDLGAG